MFTYIVDFSNITHGYYVILLHYWQPGKANIKFTRPATTQNSKCFSDTIVLPVPSQTILNNVFSFCSNFTEIYLESRMHNKVHWDLDFLILAQYYLYFLNLLFL